MKKISQVEPSGVGFKKLVVGPESGGGIPSIKRDHKMTINVSSLKSKLVRKLYEER